MAKPHYYSYTPWESKVSQNPKICQNRISVWPTLWERMTYCQCASLRTTEQWKYMCTAGFSASTCYVRTQSYSNHITVIQSITVKTNQVIILASNPSLIPFRHTHPFKQNFNWYRKFFNYLHDEYSDKTKSRVMFFSVHLGYNQLTSADVVGEEK